MGQGSHTVDEHPISDHLLPDRRVTIHDASDAWRFNVKAGSMVVGLILSANISVLIWAKVFSDRHEGSSTVFEGDCTQMETITFWADLGINIISTLLLGASNNCAQLLTSPTRKDVDFAHIRGKWLDIGVPSIRNISVMSYWRIALCGLLFVSSIPLHLLYNSVAYSTISAQDLVAAMVTERFVTDGIFNETVFVRSGGPLEEMIHIRGNIGALQRLENAECFREYASSVLISEWGNVLIITNATQDDGVVWATSHRYNYGDMGWMCNADDKQTTGETCNINRRSTNTSDWHIIKYHGLAEGDHTESQEMLAVKYCFAEPATPRCTIAVSKTLLSIVIVFNLIKLVCLLSTLNTRRFRPLATVGDAIASFLEYPDKTTEGVGPLSALDVRRGHWTRSEGKTKTWDHGWDFLPGGLRSHTSRGRAHPASRSLLADSSDVFEMLPQESSDQGCAKSWQRNRYSWFRSASIERWVMCILLCLVIWFTGLGLLFQSHGLYSWWVMWYAGLGRVDPGNIITGPVVENNSLISNVLLANSPQLIVSFVYLFYNNIFTCMVLGQEYNQFTTKRKPLRVSKPQGKQRSTYFLQLPYRYSVPIMAFMGTLHWLIARSIFLVKITAFKDGVEVPDENLSTCGYSILAILLSLLVGGIMILALIVTGCRKLDPGMPLASSCSAAISAACHVGPQEVNPALVPLQYGVVTTWPSAPANGELEHASFSSEEVTPLVEGKLYI